MEMGHLAVRCREAHACRHTFLGWSGELHDFEWTQRCSKTLTRMQGVMNIAFVGQLHVQVVQLKANGTMLQDICNTRTLFLFWTLHSFVHHKKKKLSCMPKLRASLSFSALTKNWRVSYRRGSGDWPILDNQVLVSVTTIDVIQKLPMAQPGQCITSMICNLRSPTTQARKTLVTFRQGKGGYGWCAFFFFEKHLAELLQK